VKVSLLAMANKELIAASLDPDGEVRGEIRVHGGGMLDVLQTVIVLTGGARWTWLPRSYDGTLFVLRGRVLLESTGGAWQGTAGDLLDLPEGLCGLVALDDAAVLVTLGPSV